MKVVLVESPAKIKSIGKYLGSDFKVLSTYGHVRDLPSKSGSVNPDNNFSMTWEILEKASKPLNEIFKALKKADTLILATDPDREGEAISWHVLEYLKEQKALEGKAVQRITFNAITKKAVLDALKAPRSLNQELVHAYLARLSLDYLVGFTLSPVLWRKLPGSRSAGRVQSVALRLVVEREQSIETFITQEYWTVEALFSPADQEVPFKGRLTVLGGEKLEKFSLSSETLAKGAVEKAQSKNYHVASLEKKRVKRNPPPPFTTSTLQQEASRKLGLSPSRTMALAQKLYEGIEINGEETGLITYMRTDSVQVTSEGLQDCRDYIKKSFGASFLPEEPRIYKTKAKNAQEAHEAIRPTDLNRTPQSLATLLEKQALSVYELIWKRMVASQMASADFDQMAVDMASSAGDIVFRATGSTLLFEGFLKLYRESLDEGEKDELDSSQLPLLSLKEQLSLKEIDPFQHFTQPPPRYSEASLIKKMEELGIGRPSTYARIMQVLRDREYVRLEKRQLLPEERGRLVTAFLTHYFSRYVQYDFTAGLEDQLDGISSGNLDFKKVLEDFWESFYQTIENSQNLKISDVLETLEKDLSAHLFGTGDRICPNCHEGQLGLRLGKFGAFLGCSRYPDCNYTKPLDGTSSKEAIEGSGDLSEASSSKFPQILGDDPVLGLSVSLRLGPYGIYLQWGEGSKPKRVSLPKGIDLSTLTLEEACLFGALPRDVGIHPEDGFKITAGIGRFGPYFKHGDRFVSVKSLEMVLQGSLEEAVDLIQKKAAQPSRGGKKPIATKKAKSLSVKKTEPSKKTSKGKTSQEKK